MCIRDRSDVALQKRMAINVNKNNSKKSCNLCELSEKRVIIVSLLKHYVELINSDFNTVFICYGHMFIRKNIG